MMPIVMEKERLEQILRHYPHIRLTNRAYLVRSRPYYRYNVKACGRKFLFGFWRLHIAAADAGKGE